MKAIRIDLGNGTQSLGVVFSDGYVYAHEPIADGYTSEADLRADLPGATISVIGSVVPLDEALRQLEQQVQAYVRQYNDEIHMMQLNYDRHMQYYDELKTMLEGYKQSAEASQTC